MKIGTGSLYSEWCLFSVVEFILMWAEMLACFFWYFDLPSSLLLRGFLPAMWLSTAMWLTFTAVTQEIEVFPLHLLFFLGIHPTF